MFFLSFCRAWILFTNCSASSFAFYIIASLSSMSSFCRAACFLSLRLLIAFLILASYFSFFFRYILAISTFSSIFAKALFFAASYLAFTLLSSSFSLAFTLSSSSFSASVTYPTPTNLSPTMRQSLLSIFDRSDYSVSSQLDSGNLSTMSSFIFQDFFFSITHYSLGVSCVACRNASSTSVSEQSNPLDNL